jgi:hypothetical protein
MNDMWSKKDIINVVERDLSSKWVKKIVIAVNKFDDWLQRNLSQINGVFPEDSHAMVTYSLA